MVWQASAERYELRLEARAAGLALLVQQSLGFFDSAGLAPQRFTDRRARRAALAANFRREPGKEGGKVTFSASSVEVELLPGIQDRLSWMVQLGAIAAAEPRLLGEREQIAMTVVGARGDASIWTFVSLGEEPHGESSMARVVRLQRIPETPYDTHVDIWLDAVAPHWPVRAHWQSGPNDPGLELWRTEKR